eukprot:scaffold1582_cov363-Prasinococcus_capsulatus_cf.AAC.3
MDYRGGYKNTHRINTRIRLLPLLLRRTAAYSIGGIERGDKLSSEIPVTIPLGYDWGASPASCSRPGESAVSGLSSSSGLDSCMQSQMQSSSCALERAKLTSPLPCERSSLSANGVSRAGASSSSLGRRSGVSVLAGAKTLAASSSLGMSDGKGVDMFGLACNPVHVGMACEQMRQG